MFENAIRANVLRCAKFVSSFACLAALGSASAQTLTFGGNNQHTSQYAPAAQSINSIKWQTTIDFNNTADFTHYGAPLVDAANIVFVPQKTQTDGYQVSVLNGSDGSLKYTLSSDFILPSHNWIPVFQPCVATGSFGTRLYYAGSGGTLYYVDNPDSNAHGAPVHVAFYGLTNYTNNSSGFDGTVFLNTPITVDSHGTAYFGFRVQGTAPAPLNTVQGGYARIDKDGNASYVLAGDATGDGNIYRDCHNTAPALSADESSLYVVCKGSSAYDAYLVQLDPATLATKNKVFLSDPRNGNPGGCLDDGTTSPMVAPDGDVYLGVMANPDNGSRGFMLRFTSDLQTEKTPGGFGWDYTAGIVPASMVPSYHGTSTYLLFSKYNNYANVGDGDGINKIAILDPNDTQIDPHPTANSLTEMREVLTIIGITPDTENVDVPLAIREWCINTPAVNPATHSIFAPSEDGHIYRWDLSTNSLSQVMTLGAGIGEPYIPTVMGPDGTVYVLNGGTLFALGDPTGDNITLTSNSADTRTAVSGGNLTFTAHVANTGGTNSIPTGTVTFNYRTFDFFTPVTGTLGTVALDGNGNAAVNVSSLQSGSGTEFLGSHFITAVYNGDSNFSSCSTTMLQKVHQFASALTFDLTVNVPVGQPVVLTVRVSQVTGSGTPMGMVTFYDGTNVIGQLALTSGSAVLNTNKLPAGVHNISASYIGDTLRAGSTGSTTQTVTGVATTTTLVAAPNPVAFGHSVTMTATVTSNSGTPAGSVEFFDGASSLGSAPINSNGVVIITTSAFSIGTHNLSAQFTGTGSWALSSGTTSLTVREGTVTILNAGPSPADYGQTVNLNASVVPVDNGTGSPVGSVVFRDGTAVLATVAVDGSGLAVFATAALTVGNHSLSASFVGSTGWANSAGVAPNLLVQNGVTMTVASSPNPSQQTQAVTLIATLTSANSGGSAPQGQVAFSDGSTLLANVAVDATGHASLVVTTLSVASHTIHAVFTGKAGWPGASATCTQVVNVKTGTGGPDTVAPSTPTGLNSASGPLKNQVSLSWIPSTDNVGVKYYQVWRAPQPGGTKVLIAQVTGTSFVDTLAKSGKTCEYAVIALDAAGNKSGLSDSVFGTSL